MNTVENVVYVNYLNSSIETSFFEDSSKPDSLSNILKNSVIIFDPQYLPEQESENSCTSSVKK